MSYRFTLRGHCRIDRPQNVVMYKADSGPQIRQTGQYGVGGAGEKGIT